MPSTFGDEVARQGWCTGAVIPHNLAPEILPYLARHGTEMPEVAADDWLVVISHTCDVVASKEEQEPFVEVLHCRPLEGRPRSQFADFRSTRTIDFKPDSLHHSAVVLSAHAVRDRYAIPREALRNHLPDGGRRVSAAVSQRLLEWYALRYGRPSWPNAFVRRIPREAQAALESALLPRKLEIAEVRVAIRERDEELDNNEAYHLAVYFVVDQEIWDTDADGRRTVNEAFAAFVAALNTCDGIEVNTDLSGVVSGGEFTWQETRATDLWNFANLSYRE